MSPDSGRARSLGFTQAKTRPDAWIQAAIVVLFAVAMLMVLARSHFLVQSREVVSMDFLGLSVWAPLPVTAASFRVLGAVTDGGAYALLRRSVRATTAKANAPPPRNV